MSLKFLLPQKSSNSVSRLFKGYLKFKRSFKDISRKFFRLFTENFKEVSRVFLEYFKGVSRKFQGCLEEVDTLCYKVILAQVIFNPALTGGRGEKLEIGIEISSACFPILHVMWNPKT